MDGGTRRRALAAAGGVVGFVVLLSAAAAGPVEFWHAPPPGESGPSAPQVTAPPADVGAAPPKSIHIDLDNAVLEVIATIVGVVIVASIAYAVIGLLLGWLRVRGRGDGESEPAPGVVDALPDVLPPLALDVDAQLAALAHGTPRNAIVACWLRLEDDVAAVGLPRRASETSAEFTARVLGWYALDPAPIDELARLYREARFSSHELGQHERDRALVALRRVHAMLTSPALARHEVDA
jgi:hypothetical protein